MNYFNNKIWSKITSVILVFGFLAMFFAPIVPAVAAGELSLSLKVANITRGDTTWASTNTADPGDTLKYLLTIKNNTAQNLASTVVKVSLPAGLAYQAGTTYVYTSTGKTAQPDGITSTGINMQTLKANITQYMSIGVKASSSASGNLAATAYVSATSAAQVSSIATINMSASALSNLSINARAANITRGDTNWLDTVSAKQGETVKFLLTVKNSGTGAAKNTTLHAALPAGLTYQTGTTYVYTNSGKTIEPDGIEGAGINMKDLAPDVTQYMSYNAKVDATYAGGDLVNVVYIKADNNTETSGSAKIVVAHAATITVSGSTNVYVADGAKSTTITVNIKDTSGQIIPGQPVNFSITSGGGSLSVAQATTNDSGNASFTYMANNVVGTVVIKIQANGASQDLNINKYPGHTSAANSTISASPTSVPAGNSSTIWCA